MEMKTIEDTVKDPQPKHGQNIRYSLLGGVAAGIVALALNVGNISKAITSKMEENYKMKPTFSISLNDKTGLYDNSAWQDFNGDGKVDSTEFSIEWSSKEPEDATYKCTRNKNGTYNILVSHPKQKDAKSYTPSNIIFQE
jgi:hypothetical protein